MSKKNATKAPAKKKGAPTKYDPDTHPLMAWVLAAMGKTNVQISEELTISSRTLFEWGKKNPDFLSAVRGGRAVANAKVVKSLYNRAIGYKTTERKVVQNPDGTVRKEVIEKEILPDVAAARFILVNRDPDNWKEKVAHTVGGEGGGPIPVKILKGVSMEDL
jgi:hypothetical protein